MYFHILDHLAGDKKFNFTRGFGVCWTYYLTFVAPPEGGATNINTHLITWLPEISPN